MSAVTAEIQTLSPSKFKKRMQVLRRAYWHGAVSLNIVLLEICFAGTLLGITKHALASASNAAVLTIGIEAVLAVAIATFGYFNVVCFNKRLPDRHQIATFRAVSGAVSHVLAGAGLIVLTMYFHHQPGLHPTMLIPLGFVANAVVQLITLRFVKDDQAN